MFTLRFLFVVGITGLFASPVFAHDTTGISQKYAAHNLGKKINSKADDYGACLSRNGLTIYFVSNRFSSHPHIYSAKRKALDSAWSESDYVQITNNPQDDFGTMTFDDLGRFYIATDRETRPRNNFNIWEGFGLDSVITLRQLPAPVNTPFWEASPTVTRDGADLYFASTSQSLKSKIATPTFILGTHRNADGSWTQPQSLGDNINIGDFNSSPYISPDGKFLFYSSKLKKGMEVYRQIFMSQRTGPKITDWSKAVLLPEPINSNLDAMTPYIERDGKKILFSSNRDKEGFDIYEATLPEDIQRLIAPSFPGY
jgi:hypothetical protein